jgi:hypothetical protein
MCHQDGAERLRQHRLRCRCPLAWRTNYEDIDVRRFRNSNDLGGWHSLLHHHFGVTPRVCFRRDLLQQLVLNLRRRRIWFVHDAYTLDVSMCLPCERKRLPDNADGGWRQINCTHNLLEHAGPQRIDLSSSGHDQDWTVGTRDDCRQSPNRSDASGVRHQRPP